MSDKTKKSKQNQCGIYRYREGRQEVHEQGEGEEE